MAHIRNAALAAHKASSEAKDNDAARSSARAAGQALGTAHVPSHAIVAAICAATAVRDGIKTIDVNAGGANKRNWQYQHFLDMIKRSDGL
jgi:hypothetical protein